MDIALWIIQGLLAAAFLMAGVMKVTQPIDTLMKQMPYVEDFQRTIRIIGTLEMLGAVGLTLPMLTSIIPELTPLAGVGLALLMIGAMLTHFRRHEYANIIMNVILFAFAAFVAYGRFFVETA